MEVQKSVSLGCCVFGSVEMHMVLQSSTLAMHGLVSAVDGPSVVNDINSVLLEEISGIDIGRSI